MTITHADAFEVLCLQAADNGRGEVLFGESLRRARAAVRPFMVGNEFPSVYLEFPLIGEPFLDVTVLYSSIAHGQRVNSDAAAGSEGLFDWFAGVGGSYEDISFGFELDTKHEVLPQPAVHFQPRGHTELVKPFCEAAGEGERAALYLDLAERMPEGWPLSFFGMFRGRPGSPLRVCGYHSDKQRRACAWSTSHIAHVFRSIGFASYDDAMLRQISELMALAPAGTDFQFDVLPDGSLGNTFSIDVQLAIEKPTAVRASFDEGPASRVMKFLLAYDVADGRYRLAAEAAFARAIPATDERGERSAYMFTLMPQWVKVRWTDGKLQPSKLYFLGTAGPLDKLQGHRIGPRRS